MNNQVTPDSAAPNPLDTIVALARRNWKHYGARAALLARWLRRQPAPGISRLRHLLTARHLLQRQQAYRNAGGTQSSAARYALARVAELRDSGNSARHRP